MFCPQLGKNLRMRNVVPVISGKGGVGKSTVSVNLAIALAQSGAKVALVDSDFYGPSIPTMFGGGELSQDHEGKIIPPQKYGVKYLSLGFFLQHEDDAVIWRGPMFTKALTQLFQDVAWGEVDYCIVDMPPGTGDAPLSLSQLVQVTGAIVVTTPQEVALADVRKSLSMLEKVNIDLLGVVENMSGFVAPDGSRHAIFGEGGGKSIAEKYKTRLLASIPIESAIREGGDIGVPVASDSNSPSKSYFEQLALQLVEILDKKPTATSGLKVVN